MVRVAEISKPASPSRPPAAQNLTLGGMLSSRGIKVFGSFQIGKLNGISLTPERVQHLSPILDKAHYLVISRDTQLAKLSRIFREGDLSAALKNGQAVLSIGRMSSVLPSTEKLVREGDKAVKINKYKEALEHFALAAALGREQSS